MAYDELHPRMIDENGSSVRTHHKRMVSVCQLSLRDTLQVKRGDRLVDDRSGGWNDAWRNTVSKLREIKNRVSSVPIGTGICVRT